MLPREAEKVETRDVGHSTPMTQASVRVEDGQIDPGVVGPVSGRPDDRVYLDLASVLETDDAPGGSHRARLQLDAVAAGELARARADQRVAVFQPLPEARVDGLVDEARLRQPPEEVAAGEALRQRLLTRADRKDDLVGRGELLGDLEAGVPAPDDEHRSLGDVARPPIAGAMCLPDLRIEVLGELGDVRRLEWPRSDHDLVGTDRPPVDVEDEAPILARKPAHVAVELDRELERLRVALEVDDHIVPRRVAVRVAGERQAGQRAVTPRRKERQRLPALSPRRCHGITPLENDEPAPLAGQVVAHREPRLACSDDDDLVAGGLLRAWLKLARCLAHPSRAVPAISAMKPVPPTARYGDVTLGAARR